MSDCYDLIFPAVIESFSNSINIHQDEDDCKITLPFEKPNFDAISLWVIKSGSDYIITDEGQTYGDLFLTNINTDTPKTEKKIERIKNRHNLDRAENEIRITTSQENLGDRIIDAIQAVQSISHLVYRRRKYSPSNFSEKVGSFLSDNEYKYTENVKVSEDRTVDFSVDSPNPALIETIHADNTTNLRNYVDYTAMTWIEIKEEYPNMSKIAVYDDENGMIDKTSINRLNNWSDYSIGWTEKETIIQALG